MERKTIVVIDTISGYSMNLCSQYAAKNTDIIFYKDEAQLEKDLPQADVLVTSTRGVSPEMLQKASQCRLIQKLGTGVNNICIPEATEREIFVGNVAGENALSVAEYTVSLILASCRHINIVHDKLVRENNWMKATIRDNCCELSYKTVGIVGFGNIGRRVAQLLKGFQCKILYYDMVRATPDAENSLNARYSPLDELFETADIISLHLPLNDQTKYTVDQRTLDLMQDHTVLVNTGRGGLIDEEALLEKLQQGKFLGVALDTHEKEPVLENDPLKQFDRVIFSPHTGAGTRESMERVIGRAFVNINSVLENDLPAEWDNIVNRKSLNR